jgi:hypothetical protein
MCKTKSGIVSLELNYSTSPNQILPLVIKYDTVGTHSARLWRDNLNKNPLSNNTRIITAYSVHPNLGGLHQMCIYSMQSL